MLRRQRRKVEPPNLTKRPRTGGVLMLWLSSAVQLQRQFNE